MNGLLPNDVVGFAIAAAIVVASLLAAFTVSRLAKKRLSIMFAWGVPVAVVIAIESLLPNQPAGFRMLTIIFGVLFGMKGVVSVEACRAGDVCLAPLAWFSFAAWPGMRQSVFADVPGAAKGGALKSIRSGMAGIAGGLALSIGAHRVLVCSSFAPYEFARLALALLLFLPGLSLILHFGIFHVLAGCWRLAGADCRPLFRDPFRSKSLTEFWGRRWNLAFSEMTAVIVFRPIRNRLGKGTATFAAFLFSGLLHELAISLPVHAGYGLPLLYFTLQGVATTWEEHLAKQRRPIDARPWFGRLWTIAWLVLPLPLLFHPPFLTGVILPLLGERPA